MKIVFSNNKEFEYLEAFSIEKDHYKGETRPSIEVHLPIAQTSYNEIASIVNDADIMQSFTLVGDMPTDENGNPVGMPTIVAYEGFALGNKIETEDGIITFKKYGKSQAEKENTELKAAVDTLLIAMEV